MKVLSFLLVFFLAFVWFLTIDPVMAEDCLMGDIMSEDILQDFVKIGKISETSTVSDTFYSLFRGSVKKTGILLTSYKARLIKRKITSSGNSNGTFMGMDVNPYHNNETPKPSTPTTTIKYLLNVDITMDGITDKYYDLGSGKKYINSKDDVKLEVDMGSKETLPATITLKIYSSETEYTLETVKVTSNYKAKNSKNEMIEEVNVNLTNHVNPSNIFVKSYEVKTK